MTEWNDSRLDDLSKRVDRIETKMDSEFVRIDSTCREGFERKMDEVLPGSRPSSTRSTGC